MTGSALSRHSDANIREALKRTKLRRYDQDADSLVIEELGLAHARSRIDLAVVNGCVHGYEIKSERDTLDRLHSQLAIYRRTLSRITYVCSSKHIDRTLRETPLWCGVIEAERGQRGAVRFKTLRRAKSNPDLEPLMLAHLLWRREAVQILSDRGLEERKLRKPRIELYEEICERLSLSELTREIKRAMHQRDSWRGRQVRLSYDD